MKIVPFALACAGVIGCGALACAAETSLLPRESGIERQYNDSSIRPQDDLYRFTNGKWLSTIEIPADRGNYGSFAQLRDAVQDRVRGIIEDLQQRANITDPDEKKIVDLYASFLDEAPLEALGQRPLAAEFTAIDAIADAGQVAALIAHLNRIGVDVPISPEVHQDAKDATRYAFDIRQGGLGLPDRDYYLKEDERLRKIRAAYRQHMERMLRMAGDDASAARADDILALETELAKIQWTKVDNRNPDKTYNKRSFAQVAELAPAVPWKTYFTDAGVAGKVDYVIVSQPSYFAGLGRLMEQTPVAVWKAYFRWHLLSHYSPYLNKALVDEGFAFYGKTLRDIPENRPRWKRGAELVDRALGEALGRVYVARYFPPEYKARMDQLVHNLLAAYKADIDRLEWMGPQTRENAQAKLAKITVKIGYPAKWRDYGGLRIARDDLVGNVERAISFEYARNVNKLGQPVDRGEWEMAPQAVNAYYEPERNEIVFPAAILEPPFFNAKADDAVNYGGIGGVIGHEISHGFDDEGSQYDGDGTLLSPPGWFTSADLDKFKARTHALVQQYSAFAPVPGYPINGELTLGENIADNSGMAIAYQAYRQSLGGKEAPVIDGLTGDQRFFIGWAQVWRNKARDNDVIVRIKSDPHSPGQFRGTVPEMNQDAFYRAFDVKAGDRMYLPPEKRVTIW